MLLNQLTRVAPKWRSVLAGCAWYGNVKALQLKNNETMELRPSFEWRGLGFMLTISTELRASYAAYDSGHFDVRCVGWPTLRPASAASSKGCDHPYDCKVFGTPSAGDTIGTCMVSSEGLCRLLQPPFPPEAGWSAGS